MEGKDQSEKRNYKHVSTAAFHNRFFFFFNLFTFLLERQLVAFIRIRVDHIRVSIHLLLSHDAAVQWRQ